MISMKAFIIGATIGMILVIYINVLAGYPPTHCQYMVKVKNVSGVYSCSEYPKPLKVNK